MDCVRETEVIDHRHSRWLERCEPLKVVVMVSNLEVVVMVSNLGCHYSHYSRFDTDSLILSAPNTLYRPSLLFVSSASFETELADGQDTPHQRQDFALGWIS